MESSSAAKAPTKRVERVLSRDLEADIMLAIQANPALYELIVLFKTVHFNDVKEQLRTKGTRCIIYICIHFP